MYKKLSVITSAVIWILLPKCSACLMAYMGLFSALGLGHLVNDSYVLPVIHLLLGINLAASLYLAIKEKQYLYAAISLLCAVAFIINKTYLNSNVVNIVACIVLVGAALKVRAIKVHKRRCVFSSENKMTC